MSSILSLSSSNVVFPGNRVVFQPQKGVRSEGLQRMNIAQVLENTMQSWHFGQSCRWSHPYQNYTHGNNAQRPPKSSSKLYCTSTHPLWWTLPAVLFLQPVSPSPIPAPWPQVPLEARAVLSGRSAPVGSYQYHHRIRTSRLHAAASRGELCAIHPRSEAVSETINDPAIPPVLAFTRVRCPRQSARPTAASVLQTGSHHDHQP